MAPVREDSQRTKRSRKSGRDHRIVLIPCHNRPLELSHHGEVSGRENQSAKRSNVSKSRLTRTSLSKHRADRLVVMDPFDRFGKKRCDT